MKEDAPDHRKMKRLARLLKIPLPYANGIMERLWHHAGKYVPDGGIGRLSDEDIAEACAMPIEMDCNVFVKALEDSGFLDPLASCRLFIHGWPEHCTYYIHNKIARQLAYFADGSKPILKRLDHRYRPAAENFYGVAATDSGVAATDRGSGSQSVDSSAHVKSNQKHTNVGVAATEGQKAANAKPLRARERPTPTPTPTPTPIEAIRKSSNGAAAAASTVNGNGNADWPIAAAWLRSEFPRSDTPTAADLAHLAQTEIAKAGGDVAALTDQTLTKALKAAKFDGQRSAKGFNASLPTVVANWSKK